MHRIPSLLLLSLLTQFFALSPAAAFTHFQGRQAHPVDLTPDGRHLLTVNTTDGRLGVHNLGDPSRPVLIAEIPTGIEPVSVRARTDDEVWVVNEASDTVAVVSISRRAVVAVLPVPDEPADVVFAQGRAFVSCAGNRQLRVFDASTLEVIGNVALDGVQPRALAVSADGERVLVAYLLSGNGTTLLPADRAPAPPPPTDPTLPPAPRTGLIVPADDPRIDHVVLDLDVAEIDARSLEILRTTGGLGTHLFALAARPGTDEVWVAASESHNLIRFEPELRGRFASHHLSRFVPGGDELQAYDLNSWLEANPGLGGERALAQPTGLAFRADGGELWVTAHHSDRVARVEPDTGEILSIIDLRPPGVDSDGMRGPRGLALHPDGRHLYVLNKLSDTLGVIDAVESRLLSEQPLGTHHPMPLPLRQGRGFFNDARRSVHGTVSCATCHLDADRDGLAWDLGDPGGSMVTVPGSALSAHITSLVNRQLHPMKGPMVTQTLRGMAFNDAVPGALITPANPAAIVSKFHWRGDMPTIQSFNILFESLLGGEQLAASEMEKVTDYLLSIRHAPNPHRLPDRSLPPTLHGANPIRGRDLFNDHLRSHCSACHALPAGTDQNLDLTHEFGGTQPMKNPPLRTTYQRAGLFDGRPGAVSPSGFGLGSDGSGHALPTVHPYILDELETAADLADVTAFILAFDSGTAPAAAASLRVTAGNALAASTQQHLRILESARAADADLGVHAWIAGERRAFWFDRAAGLYLPDDPARAALGRESLLGLLEGEHDSLHFLGFPAGRGRQATIDRNQDGSPDRALPAPELRIEAMAGPLLRLSWQGAAGWHVERREMPHRGQWSVFPQPPAEQDGEWSLIFPPVERSSFYRLQRNW